MADSKHPAQLGKYRITAVLGEGAMGVVYKGFDPDIQRTVALKTIRQNLDADDDSPGAPASRFRNEAQAAGRLMHPGIVAVYYFGRDQHIAYIAMEYVEGRSLASYLSSKVRFTDTDIPGIMSQLLDALGHAHDNGVWHRDVKPANIIMMANGRLKVADFGIARIESTQLTQTHYMVGTPSHMAPEQFLGKPMDRRVDIYGAGVVLYQLLTGRAPFAGTTEALMYKVVNELPPPPSSVEGADRPGWFDAIIARALAKRADERYDTAEAFKQALIGGAGQAIDDTAWEKTLLMAPPRPARAPMAPSTIAPPSLGSPSTGSPPPSHWDKAQLTQARWPACWCAAPRASAATSTSSTASSPSRSATRAHATPSWARPAWWPVAICAPPAPPAARPPRPAPRPRRARAARRLRRRWAARWTTPSSTRPRPCWPSMSDRSPRYWPGARPPASTAAPCSSTGWPKP